MVLAQTALSPEMEQTGLLLTVMSLSQELVQPLPFTTTRCKATLASLLRGVQVGLHLNEHFERCSEVVFRHACWMGLEGG